MIETIALALLAAIAFALSDLAATPLVRRVGVGSTLIASQWTGGLMLAIGFAFSWPSAAPAASYAVAAGAGVGIVGGQALMLRALQLGPLTIIGPLTALQGPLVAVVALIQGVPISRATAVGLAFAAVGGVLGAVPGRQGRADRPASSGAFVEGHARTAAALSLLAAMFFASSFLLFGQEDALPAADAGAVAFLGGTTPVLLFMLLTRRARGSLLRTRGLAMRIGAIEALGLFSAVAALRHGPLVVAAIVLGLFAPASAVMGLVWLRERLSILQVFGVLATIIAVMAFAL